MARAVVAYGYKRTLVEDVEEVNNRQKGIVFDKLSEIFDGCLQDKVIAVWGLAFKPETDDMRQAPSLVVIDRLWNAGARIRVFDPVAMGEARQNLGDKVTYCTDPYHAVEQADALILITEWKQFRLPEWNVIRSRMKGNVIIDGRNIYDAGDLKAEGFRYFGIGKKSE